MKENTMQVSGRANAAAEEQNSLIPNTRRLMTYLPDGVTKIVAACQIYDIEVRSADVEEISVLWDESSIWGISAEYAGDIVYLKELSFFGVQSILDAFAGHRNKTLRIILPEGYAGDLILSTSVGDVGLSGIKGTKNIDVKTTKGRVGASGIDTRGDACLDSADGGVWMEKAAVGGRARLQSLSGGMYAQDVQCGSDFMAVGMTGECGFHNIRAAGYFSVSVDSGSMECAGIAADKVDIASVNSHVDAHGLRAESLIAIHTAAGNIACGVDDVYRSYSCYCFSKHGECSFPYHTGNGNKALHVDSDQGTINVQFEREEVKNSEAAAAIPASCAAR